MKKTENGITLVVLVITIVILLILAGITIAAVSGGNGLLANSKKAKNNYGISKAKEFIEIEISNLQVDKMVNESRAAELRDLNEFDNTDSNNYTDEIKLKTPVKEGDTSSILIYDGYEVEVSSELKVGKINGKDYTTGDGNNNGGSQTGGDNSKTDNDEKESVKSDIQVTLGDGMIPIKYSNGGWYICSKDDEEWFNYEKKLYANVTLMDDLTTDKHTNEEIKAMTTREQLETLAGDRIQKYGSMFVWIPRYAYKITSGYHDGGVHTSYRTVYSGGSYVDREYTGNVSGSTSVKFIDTNNYYRDGSGKVTNYTPASYYDYVVHPAFDWGGEKLEGIWIAKYEASASATQNYNNDFPQTKYVPDNSLDAYVGISIDESIAMAKLLTSSSNKNYYGTEKSSIDPHLIKNTEWGAAAYMAYSEYGMVPSVARYTSHGGSMTGNETGIYDMAGRYWEYVAAYVPCTNSSYVDSNGIYRRALAGLDSKYKDTYGETRFVDQLLIMDKMYDRIGDAIYETGRYGDDDGCNAWGNDINGLPYTDTPVFARGGCYDDGTGAGICAVGRTTGKYDWATCAFRSCIVVTQ